MEGTAPPPTPPLLTVLYASQTGNAQDAAERICREARLRLYRARVLPMDAYPTQHLPSEAAVVFVAATAGQGDPPDTMRRFWRLLLRKSLPPDALAGLPYAVFGLGDSGYVDYNVVAKKLDRRLSALGARPLLERGLGDDQHPSGYEAALDPWVAQLWPALRRVLPLPPGVAEPIVDAAALATLPEPRYEVTLLPTPPAAPTTAPSTAPTPDGAAPCNGATAASGDGGGLPSTALGSGDAGAAALGAAGSDGLSPEEARLLAAAHAAAAFRAVAADAAAAPLGRLQEAGGGGGGGGADVAADAACAPPFGPWQPFMAPLAANARLTAAGHWQDTRHLVFDLRGSGMDAWEPGDVLAVFPRAPEEAVRQLLARVGLDGGAWVRVRARRDGDDDGGDGDAGGGGARRPEVVATVAALLQVAQHFAHAPHERARLQQFASCEGRDDLHRYCRKERRSVAEVLSDFPSVQLPLEWLLEAAPQLHPRLFSIASSAAASRGAAAVAAAVVQWTTPSRRARRGLATRWLAALPALAVVGPAAAATGGEAPAGRAARVPVWVERGALRMPRDRAVPLILVGPGTGVAPFRAFLQERAHWVRAAAAAGCGDGGGASPAAQQQQQGEVTTAAAAAGVAPCYLFFGCRAPDADFYYAREWRELQRLGVLHPTDGLITAFSRAAAGPSDDAAAAQPPAGGAPKKVYVTHRILEHGALVWRLLSAEGAAVYVSGAAQRMPADVAAAFADVAREHGDMAADAAAAWVRGLQQRGRYHVEAWS